MKFKLDTDNLIENVDEEKNQVQSARDNYNQKKRETLA